MSPTPQWIGDTGEVRIDCAAYVDGCRNDFDPDTMTIDGTVEEDGFVWLGLRMPTEEELSRGLDTLGMTGVSVAEVLAPHARPVLTIEGSVVQIVLRTAAYEDRSETIALGEMTLLASPRGVISIRHGQASQLASLRAKLERDPERLKLGPTAVVAAVIGLVIDDYGPALDGFENDAIEVERDVFSDSHHQPVQRLYRLKREVRRLIVAIDSLDDPLRRLIGARGPQMPPEVLADLNEAADQLDRAVTRAHSLSSLLDAALDGQPHPDLGASERRHAQDQRLGRDGRGADDDRRHLRHELRHHARAAVGLRLPARPWHDRRDRWCCMYRQFKKSGWL